MQQDRDKLHQPAKPKLHTKKLIVVKITTRSQKNKIRTSQMKINQKTKNLHLQKKERELRVMIQKIRQHVWMLMKMVRQILLKESVFHRSKKHVKIAYRKCRQKRRPNFNACKRCKKCVFLFRLEKVTTALRVHPIRTFPTKITPPPPTRRPKLGKLFLHLPKHSISHHLKKKTRKLCQFMSTQIVKTMKLIRNRPPSTTQ